jgi:hypothetical protein
VRLLLAALFLLLAWPAQAAYQFTDIACETSVTAGTGTLDLAGAKSGGYLGIKAAGITSGNTVPYTLTTGTGATRKVETGFGVFTDGTPDTLTRVAQWSTDGSGAELDLATTSTVCVGPIAGLFTLGAGSTIDADKLDGITSADFLTEAEAAAAYEPLGVTLGTDTTGDYVAGVADGTGIDGTATGEGSTYTPTFDATELTGTTTFGNGSTSTVVAGDLQSGDDVLVGDDVTLSALDGVVSIGADTTFTRVDASDSLVINTDVDNDGASSVISLGVDGNGEALLSATEFYPGANDGSSLGMLGNAWADLWLASGGLIEFNGATDSTFTCATGNCSIEGNGLYRAGGTDVAVADGGTGASSLNDLIALSTMTSGVYVAQVADGTGIDGTANAEGATYTPSLDFTEITAGTGLTATNATTLDCDTANTTTVGCVEVATQAEADAKTAATVPAASVLDNYSRGLLWGLTISNNAGDLTNDIDVTVGVAASSVTPYPLMENTTAALTKQIDAAWAVGDAAGGLDGTESVAGTPDTSTWYHVYLIQRSDTGVVDVAFSENASAPERDGTPIPAAYDHYRRIGSVYNNGSGNIYPFTQNGDIFTYVTVNSEQTDNADVAWGLQAILVPLGIKTQPMLTCEIITSSGNAFALVGDPNVDTGSATHFFYLCSVDTTGTGVGSLPMGIFSNTSSQIYYRFEEGTTVTSSNVRTVGYIDARGRQN